MSSSCNRESLSRKRTAIAVVRLVVNGSGELTHGEVLNDAGRVVARFRAWSGLVPALQSWLARESAGDGTVEAERIDRTQPRTENPPDPMTER